KPEDRDGIGLVADRDHDATNALGDADRVSAGASEISKRGLRVRRSGYRFCDGCDGSNIGDVIEHVRSPRERWRSTLRPARDGVKAQACVGGLPRGALPTNLRFDTAASSSNIRTWRRPGGCTLAAARASERRFRGLVFWQE